MTAKAYGDYTIADVIRLRPSWLLEKQADQGKRLKEEQIPHLNFLISALSHVATYRFEELFGGLNIYDLDLNAINQKIMSHVPAVRSMPVPQHDLAPSLLSRFDIMPLGAMKPFLEVNKRAIIQQIEEAEKRIKACDRDFASHEQHLIEYRNYMMDALRTKRAIELTLEGLRHTLLSNGQKLDPRRLAIVKSIPKQWLLVAMDDDSFTVARRTPVIITHASIAKTLNLGFCAIKFDWRYLAAMHAAPIGDYIGTTGSGFYPHLAKGSICWGNQTNRAERLVEEQKYDEYWTLLESILTTYCGDNPYIGFTSLEEKYHNHWNCVSTDRDSGFAWFKGSLKATLMREWSKNGSEKYLLEWEKQLPKEASGATVITTEKRQRMTTFINNFVAKFIYPKIEDFKARVPSYMPADRKFLYASEFLQACKELGVPVLDRDICIRYGINLGGLPSAMQSIMLLWHGSYPTTEHPHITSARDARDTIGIWFRSDNSIRFAYCNEEIWSTSRSRSDLSTAEDYDKWERARIIAGFSASSISLAAPGISIEQAAQQEIERIRTSYSGSTLTRLLDAHANRARTVPNLTALSSPNQDTAADTSNGAATAQWSQGPTVVEASYPSDQEMHDSDDSDSSDDCDHSYDSTGECEHCGYIDHDYCEHPERSNNGYCLHCDQYSEEHDDRLNDASDETLDEYVEELEEEVAAVAAPF